MRRRKRRRKHRNPLTDTLGTAVAIVVMGLVGLAIGGAIVHATMPDHPVWEKLADG